MAPPLLRGLLIWLLCSPAESTSCPTGSFYVPRGKCLTFKTIGAPHDAAEAYCQQAFPGGHLATYTSKGEHNAMLKFIDEANTAPLRGQHLWFGMDMRSGGSMTTERFANPNIPWTNDAYSSYPFVFPDLHCVVISSFDNAPDANGVNQHQKGLLLRTECSRPMAYGCSFNAGVPKGISAHFQSFEGRLDDYHLLALERGLLREGDCRVRCLLHVQCHSYSFHRGAVTLNKSCFLYWLGTNNSAAFFDPTNWSHGLVLGHRSFQYS